MARGFGTTLGAGTTDAVRVANSTHYTQTRYAFWSYRRAGVHAAFERLFDKGSFSSVIFFNDNTPGVYSFRRIWSGDDGTWNITAPATGAWHHFVLDYDEGATINDPLIWMDGTPVTVTQSGGDPTGSPATVGDVYTIGNNNAGTAPWDGMTAEFAIWNGLGTAAEAAALGKGYSPLWFPRGLKVYVPMVRAAHDYADAASTLTGTAVQTHPRVIYPPWTRRGFLVAAAPAFPDALYPRDRGMALLTR